MIYIDRTSEATDCVCDAPGGSDDVPRLEREIKAKLGKHAVLTSAADDALLAALHLVGAREGDYVFLPTFSFYSIAATVEYSGFVPVFIDCEPITRCVSESALETALLWTELQGKPPAAAVIDDAFGSIPDYDRLLPLCSSRGIPTIELACDALGGRHKTAACGTNCDYGVISFVKSIHGGGGALLCDKADVQKAKAYVRAEYTDGENRNCKMHNVIAALDYGLLAAFDKIAAHCSANAKYLCAHSERILPRADGDAGAYVLARTLGRPLAPFKTMRIMPVHRLPRFCDAPFFEHEKGFSVCDTFRDCTLIDTDFSPLLRRKLLRMIDC